MIMVKYTSQNPNISQIVYEQNGLSNVPVWNISMCTPHLQSADQRVGMLIEGGTICYNNI